MMVQAQYLSNTASIEINQYIYTLIHKLTLCLLLVASHQSVTEITEASALGDSFGLFKYMIQANENCKIVKLSSIAKIIRKSFLVAQRSCKNRESQSKLNTVIEEIFGTINVQMLQISFIHRQKYYIICSMSFDDLICIVLYYLFHVICSICFYFLSNIIPFIVFAHDLHYLQGSNYHFQIVLLVDSFKVEINLNIYLILEGQFQLSFHPQTFFKIFNSTFSSYLIQMYSQHFFIIFSQQNDEV